MSSFAGLSKPDNSSFHIIWAARWEHDKNPDDLLAVLRILRDGRFDFQVSVIGPSLQVKPNAILEIKKELADRILHWGYMPTRHEYSQALASADCFISTANHEFFGLSAAEAIAAGTIPLLPNRLSYPELLNIVAFPERDLFLYDQTPDSLADKIVSFADSQPDERTLHNLRGYFQQTYGWESRAARMDQQLTAIAELET